MPLPLQRWIVGIVIVVVALIVSARLLPMRLLLFDREVREMAKETLEKLSDERGWLLSDIEVDSVDTASMRLTYRPHLHGYDPQSCFVASFDSSDLTPCNDD